MDREGERMIRVMSLTEVRLKKMERGRERNSWARRVLDLIREEVTKDGGGRVEGVRAREQGKRRGGDEARDQEEGNGIVDLEGRRRGKEVARIGRDGEWKREMKRWWIGEGIAGDEVRGRNEG
ncbi:hypothetical protein ACH5RR_031689 [Cinchona calisaya]|uniref:Uncharacterized protein n=1 Tax=Cinchona calisaya TaxID=153742 RepID=A0ABD2YFZ9_9GENT